MNTVKTTGRLWNYYRDEPNNPPAANYNSDCIKKSDSFKYKSSITGKTSNANQEDGEVTEQEKAKTKKNLEIIVPIVVKILEQFLEKSRHAFN